MTHYQWTSEKIARVLGIKVMVERVYWGGQANWNRTISLDYSVTDCDFTWLHEIAHIIGMRLGTLTKTYYKRHRKLEERIACRVALELAVKLLPGEQLRRFDYSSNWARYFGKPIPEVRSCPEVKRRVRYVLRKLGVDKFAKTC